MGVSIVPRIPDRIQDMQDFQGPPVDGGALVYSAALSKYVSENVAIDDEVVHNTGNESVDGNKSFTGSTVFNTITLGNTVQIAQRYLYANVVFSNSGLTYGQENIYQNNLAATATVAGKFNAIGNHPSGNMILLFGLNGAVSNINAGTVTQLVALSYSANSSGSGAVADLKGADIQANQSSSGNVTRLKAVDVQINVNTTGTLTDLIIGDFRGGIVATGGLTNFYGVRIGNITGSATPTNSYGIYVDASIDKGTVLKYALYSLSTSPSLLSGSIQATSFIGDGSSLTALNASNIASGTLDDARLSSNIATKAYADALVVGLIDDRGSFDASGNVFPSSGGSGTAGVILKGDLWFISVAGILGGVAVTAGDSVRALVDTPGQTAGNWSVLESNLTYVPENVANKATGFGVLNDTLYPTVQAVSSYAQPLNANLTTYAGIAPSADVQTLLGAANFATFRTSLGVAIGSDVQAFSARLDEIAVIGLALQQIRVNAGGTALEYFTSSASGANTSLSNLASVAINTDLLPASTQGLGNASFPFLSCFIGNTTQYESVSQSAGLITHSALGSATNIGFTFTPKGVGSFTIGGSQAANSTVPQLQIGPSAQTGFNTAFANLGASGGNIVVIAAGSPVMGFSGATANAVIASPRMLAFASGSNFATPDVAIKRNGIGIIEFNNATAGQWASILVGVRDAGTTTVTNGLTVGHQSTGTPAAGFGSAILFNINSSTTADQNAGQIAMLWTTATHASRTADFVVSLVNAGAALAEKFRVTATGNLNIVEAGNIVVGTSTGTKVATDVSQKLGFWNATPIVQPSGSAQAALTNSTGGTGNGTLEDVATVGVADPAKINNNFTELFTLLDAMRTAAVNSGLIKGAA
jgi:hypothetical protein